ncbi:hypothetical protein LPJ64_000025 [Coemansia asiatica]|uniref:Ras GEF n=1 Tax=Coemansia asiatica TaxID=1052880 RepID=A0A9W8CN86_9FUNG|nr:hypothetical protein LPJ64_000025 [Coemansia asiatica]
MAFYFNQGNRREKGHERTALGSSPLKPSIASTASQSNNLDNSNIHHPSKTKQQQQQQQPTHTHTHTHTQTQRRRERIGETLRIGRNADRSGNPLRDIRLAKIFGEPVLDASGSRHKIALVDTYSTRDILFNSSGRVSYGTWYGLIMYLTQAHQQIEEYTQAFFLTFRSFATSRDLAEALVHRSRLQPSHGLNAADARLWQNRVKEPIQNRVFMAIKLWYEKYWWAYNDDGVLPYLCGFLINEYLPSRHGSAAKECLKFLQAVKCKNKFIHLRQLRANYSANVDDGTSSRSPAYAPSVHRKDAVDLESTTDGTPSSRIPTRSLWQQNTQRGNDNMDSETSNVQPCKRRDSEHMGLFRKLFSRTNITSMPSDETITDNQQQQQQQQQQPMQEDEVHDSSSGNDEPDITDLLMATVGMDLSLEAYRRISNILSLNPVDVACQLTIIESSCYCQIRPYELLNKEFSRGERSKAHNIRQMTRWSTQISRWASMLILNEHTPERRCRVLRYFIELGMQLLALKNYDALMAIKGAIYCAGVMRLKKTWSLLPKKYTIMCRRLLEAMNSDHNYANYRELLRKSQPPLLPFLGQYLTDLTFLEDGNPTYRRYVYPQEESSLVVAGKNRNAPNAGWWEDGGSSSDHGYGQNGSIGGGSHKSRSISSSSCGSSCSGRSTIGAKDPQEQGRGRIMNNTQSINSYSDNNEDDADEKHNQQSGAIQRPNNVQLTGQTCALFAQRNEVDLSDPSILINFEKPNRIAEIIQEIQKFQVEYSGNFTMAIPGLQQYLIEQWRLYESYDDDRIYDLSLQREPRASLPTQNNMDYFHQHHHHLSTTGGIRLSRLIPGRNKEQQVDGLGKRVQMSPIDTDDSGSSIF